MPLQNRVDPFGAVHAAAARGLFTGNRGVLHDPDRRILLRRRWTTRAWIVCDCDFGDRRRDVMGRNAPAGGAGWTNLFFLDEVTALAAGHRPCFFCRRAAADAFADAFGVASAIERPKVAAIDARLHRERRLSEGPSLPVDRATLAALPDGAMIEAGGAAFALRGGYLLPWSFDGYGTALAPPALREAPTLITPPSTVAALRAGFRPVWHHSAEGDPNARERVFVWTSRTAAK